jgi:hypothetical protein
MQLAPAVDVAGNTTQQGRGHPCINPSKQVSSRLMKTLPLFVSFPDALFLNNCNAIFQTDVI